MLRPSEESAISRGKEAKMVTLGTAAASRGTDFNDITAAVLAKPGLYRGAI